MIYFTSDLHFGHAKVIQYCKRPFANVDEMDEALIKRWNAVGAPSDLVYIVGDFSFHKPKQTENILRRLGGNKILILGNHDKPRRMSDEISRQFGSIHHYLEIKVPDSDAHKGEQLICLLHYAMRVWNKSHHGSWSLYGHSHGSLSDDPNALSMDVGVDCHNFTPVSYDQVKAFVKRKTFKPVDHHTGDY